MKSVSQLVGPNDAQKKPNTHEQMKSPTVEVHNAIINVANPEKEALILSNTVHDSEAWGAFSKPPLFP